MSDIDPLKPVGTLKLNFVSNDELNWDIEIDRSVLKEMTVGTYPLYRVSQARTELTATETYALVQRVINEATSRLSMVMVDENRRQQTLRLVRSALDLALSSHGVTLTSLPPQDAWESRNVSSRLREALSAINKLINEN